MRGGHRERHQPGGSSWTTAGANHGHPAAPAPAAAGSLAAHATSSPPDRARAPRPRVTCTAVPSPKPGSRRGSCSPRARMTPRRAAYEQRPSGRNPRDLFTVNTVRLRRVFVFCARTCDANVRVRAPFLDRPRLYDRCVPRIMNNSTSCECTVLSAASSSRRRALCEACHGRPLDV